MLKQRVIQYVYLIHIFHCAQSPLVNFPAKPLPLRLGQAVIGRDQSGGIRQLSPPGLLQRSPGHAPGSLIPQVDRSQPGRYTKFLEMIIA